jgi:nitronate monooxygenase
MEGAAILPFPVQNSLTMPIRKHAQATHNAEYQAMYTGQRYEFCESGPAERLIQRLARELEQKY